MDEWTTLNFYKSLNLYWVYRSTNSLKVKKETKSGNVKRTQQVKEVSLQF